MRTTFSGVICALLLIWGVLVGVAPARTAEPVVTDGCVESVPEPGTSDPVQICYTLHRPAGATADAPVPLVMHSHGWAGSRTSAPGSFSEWLEAGFGVVSFDQRGFGESGGLAHIEHPDFEGQDVARVIDHLAALDWVAKDAPGDPRLGAIGGSYGGAYQFLGAFTELRDKGVTRFDALAPQMTWWDLRESLAPEGVPRTGWATALYAAGASALPEIVHHGFAYAAATGDWPAGQNGLAPDLESFFEKNGPAWHVSEGRRLDIPALLYQGHTDNLFNLNQGLKNFERALTPSARAESLFVGYNGGHALPSVHPAGVQASGEPCAPTLTGVEGDTYSDVALLFMREQLLGEDTALDPDGSYHFATQDGGCVPADQVSSNQLVELIPFIANSAAGPPLLTDVAEGPVTVLGAPVLEASVTTTGLGTRLFFALAVGTSPLDARIVQNNMLPLHEPAIVTSARRSIELPGIAVEVPDGQNLYLMVSAVSDMSFGHGSRLPGIARFDDPVLRLDMRRPPLVIAGRPDF